MFFLFLYKSVLVRLKNTFLSVLNSIAPVKEIRLKQRTEPWMSGEILDLISQRDKYLHTFKKDNSQDDYKYYCKLRNRVQKEINITKIDYFSNKIEENKYDSRKLWQQLKN